MPDASWGIEWQAEPMQVHHGGSVRRLGRLPIEHVDAVDGGPPFRQSGCRALRRSSCPAPCGRISRTRLHRALSQPSAAISRCLQRPPCRRRDCRGIRSGQPLRGRSQTGEAKSTPDRREPIRAARISPRRDDPAADYASCGTRTVSPPALIRIFAAFAVPIPSPSSSISSARLSRIVSSVPFT